MTNAFSKHAPQLGEKASFGALGGTGNTTTCSMQGRRGKAKFLGAAIALIFLSGCSVPVSKQVFTISGFKPTYPQQTANVRAGLNVKVYSVFTEVDSTQPELAWVAFPGVHEKTQALGLSVGSTPFVEADLSKVSNVTYEIKICEVAADKDPWGIDFGDISLAYEKTSIAENKHKVERPLKPGTRYVWSIRSRFHLEGQPRLSEWTAINSLGGYNLNVGRRAVRKFGRIHPALALRFKTPGTAPAASAIVPAAVPDAVCGENAVDASGMQTKVSAPKSPVPKSGTTASRSGTESRATPAVAGRVTDRETFRRQVVGRPLVNPLNGVRIVIEPNGRLRGHRGNEELTGKWQFRNGYFCRSFLVGGTIGQEDCSTIFLDTNGITITRQEGRGRRVKYEFAEQSSR
jgi:hypothetical protein